MRLAKVKIQGFRSIRDEQVLFVDRLVTVLIGANDHGKSNILEAIRALNEDRLFIEADKNWDSTETDLPTVEYEFNVDDNDRVSLPTDPAAEEGTPVLESVRYVRRGIGTPLIVEVGGPSPTPNLTAALLKMRPRVELFQIIRPVVDSITLATLTTPDSEFMQGIFRKAGVWDERDTLFTQNPRTAKRLADASARLTERLRAEWEQGRDLTFHLKHGGTSGDTIMLYVEDPAVQSRYVPPSLRISGFSAFFVLNLTLYARREANPSNSYIFVFDEPGTYLHPQGQANLQRVLEALAVKNQIVYSTHALFMVNKNSPNRNRVITKTEGGTLIDHKPYLSNWKAVRSSLGLLFTNNFFISDSTLLVEGPSDAIYVLSMLRSLNALDKIDADLNLFSIEDSGNAADYIAMAKVMADEGRRVVALFDGDDSGKQIGRRLEKLNQGLPGTASVAILKLDEGTSVEDYVLYPDSLITAVSQACKELVTAGIREFADGTTIENVDERVRHLLSDQGGATLGRKISKVTADLMKDDEAISKLHIARVYDDTVEGKLAGPGRTDGLRLDPALRLSASIVKGMDLRGKLAEALVLE